MALHRIYLSASLIGFGGKFSNILATLGTLWFLNALLDKHDFGLFMIAFSITFTLGMIIGSGFQSLLLYHVSRLHEDGDEKNIRKIAGQIFWITAALGLAAAFLTALLTPLIETAMGQEGLSFWLWPMSFFIPAHAAAIVLPTLPRARQDGKTTIFYQEILLNMLRVLFLGGIWLWAMPAGFIAGAYIVSALIPVIWAFLRFPVWPDWREMALTRWDMGYTGKITLFQILNQPFRGFDVILVGALASATAAADYTMAARLAQLLWIPKHAAANLQVPRMGALLKKNDRVQLMLEYDAMRIATLWLVILGCAGILWFGPWVLRWFGDYAHAMPVLLILSAAAVIRTGAGASGDLISMIGLAGWSVLVAAASMIVTLGGGALLIPALGPEGAALGVLAGTIVLFGGYWAVLKSVAQMSTFSLPMFLVSIAASLILIGCAFHHLHPLGGGFLLLVMGILMIAFDRSWLRFITMGKVQV